MGLYDDGGVAFAEQKFAEAKQFKIDQAKSQDKFARKLLGIDTVVQGISEVINQRAKEADDSLMWQRSKYEELISRSQSTRELNERNKEKGITNLQYLEENLYNKMIEEAAATYTKTDLDSLKPVIMKYSKTLAKDGLQEYEDLIKASYSIPKFGENGEEFEAYYNSQAADTPRSISDWVGKKVRKVLKTNDKETLKNELPNSKEFDPKAGAFAKFGELEQAIKSYHAYTEKGFDLSEVIKQAQKDGVYLGKVVKINEPKESITFDYEKGIKTTRLTQTMLRENINNIEVDGKVPNYIVDSYNLGETATLITENRMTFSDIQNIKKLAQPGSDLAISLDNILSNNPTFANGTLAMQEINKYPNQMAVDWSNETDKMELFNIWYSNIIKTAEHPSKKGTYLGEFDNKLNLYVPNNLYKDIIEQTGYDRKTQFKIFNQLGVEGIINGANNINNDNTNIEYTPLSSSLKDNNELEILKTLTEPDGLAFDPSGFDLGRKIEQANIDGLDYVNLGNQDIGKVLELPSLKGTNLNLYWDIKNNSFVTGK